LTVERASGTRRLVDLSAMRRAVGRRMVESKREAPHFYVSTEIEMDAARAHVEALNDAAAGPRVTLTALLVRGCALALREHEGLNAVWAEGGLEVSTEINIGIAIALEEGLVAPALLGCDSLDIQATAAALEDLVERAHHGRLRGREMTEGTFTLSNLGMFDVTQFTAIVTPPQVAILATGKVDRLPRFAGEHVVPRRLMIATVSADHRAVDGADVARFLGTLKYRIESPKGLDD
jgi:pyruvate dehydrogenase E2 component (dihydrolipoyllysine-residue acetyltransferase)